MTANLDTLTTPTIKENDMSTPETWVSTTWAGLLPGDRFTHLEYDYERGQRNRADLTVVKAEEGKPLLGDRMMLVTFRRDDDSLVVLQSEAHHGLMVRRPTQQVGNAK